MIVMIARQFDEETVTAPEGDPQTSSDQVSDGLCISRYMYFLFWVYAIINMDRWSLMGAKHLVEATYQPSCASPDARSGPC
jgi:hypothetical protein